MTRQEFVKDRDACVKRWTMLMVALFGLLTLPLLLLDHDTAFTVTGILIPVIIIGLLVSHRRTFGRVRCPHCHQSLINSHSVSSAVIASGNCGWCGGKVLDEASKDQ